ncbi:hypothetical protein M2459_001564 [Parabacteroides sp. PF5-5]|uniref:PKD domain-containing protein n=1 Tax=unclassified Parabacteroides TaxID=2649774 RepID=UPI0024736541|nr:MULTISPECIES: PKD domain-containing protein [unclassified Parabacteroides]MDH6304828.1 hypothetical protein [Parabacteroides sp. PH5-39]MDH6315558.1 hypothetical protein [Parabacteroides sp. PF5-13]MDH6319218.1 hypothetical protein [Parabacteroides sp. PH5-13]MDH6322949.1 hypothetical protein [Parabacteroides sp. PH5-8]MDH6326751.1 hypothetical protein [Parabacteroides sp. PH5-41]
MKRIIYIACLLSTIAFSGQAQKETSNWFFGKYAGLTWNTTQSETATGINTADKQLDGLPTSVTGKLFTEEGCSSISDDAGNLLFYSDGRTIWDKNHNQMPNGNSLDGNSSSVQSCIVVPVIGSLTQYYIITISVSITSSPYYLSYSVVDMTLNNGLGDVVTEMKNIRFTGETGKLCESVAVVKHANGKDMWVLAPGGPGSNSTGAVTLNAWLITESGVTVDNPVKTLLPIDIQQKGALGYLTFSPSGRYFAWATSSAGVLFFAKFDTSTGEVQNIKYINFAGNSVYGTAFSLSGDYLYITRRMRSESINNITVYKVEDLIAAPNGSIAPFSLPYKDMNIPSDTPGQLYYMDVQAAQLGLDGRMYFVAERTDFLYVIDNPEEFENLRLYRLPNGFLVPNSCQLGLPSFANFWWYMDRITTDKELPVCYGEAIRFIINVSISGLGNDLTKIEWNFGDGTIINDTNPTHGVLTKTHTYASPGTYTLTVTPYVSGVASTENRKTLEVTVVNCGSLTTSLTGDENLIINEEGSYTITINDTTGELASCTWDFGDGSALVTGGSTTHSKPHTYKKRGYYTVTVSFYDADSDKIGEESLRVKVGSGMLPVNHNISVMGY